MSKLLDQKIQGLKARVEEGVKDLHQLSIKIGSDDLAKTVSDLRNRINEPFMFVIVGEVKAGKSSFVNALLGAGKEVAKAAPQPMTDTIQQIVYGDEEETITINPHLKRITIPVEILREIAIVDTPGTNTIIEHHQEITESFIPASDLIVFVFESKNPYRQSAWDFFSYIHADWQRKIIFVLQQKDLMNEADLAVNVDGVTQQAQKKGIENPVVFAVSAKLEQEGDWLNSGYIPLREYIQQNITGGKAPVLKIGNNVATCQNINQRIGKGLFDRQAQYDADVTFRADIKETLDTQEGKSNKQVDNLVESLLHAYDRTTAKTGEELKDGLSFGALVKRSFSSIFSKKASLKDWLSNLSDTLENDLNKGLTEKLDEGVGELAASIQQMTQIVDLKIRNSRTILQNDHDLFSAIAERRNNVLKELQDAFARFMAKSENFADESLFPNRKEISPDLAAGGGLAVVGIILAAVTNGMVLDITGGVLTAVGFLFAGVSAQIKKRKIMEGFQQEVAKGRAKLEEDVNGKLKKYTKHLSEKIDRQFLHFDAMLEKEEVQLKELHQEHKQLEERLTTLQQEAQSLI